MRRRPLVAALVCLAALLAFVQPAAAQAVNRELFERLNQQFLYVALPLTVFVELILLYAVVRFRNNDDPQPTSADPALEVTWTVATAVILLFVGFSAYTVLGSPYMSPGANVAAEERPGDRVADAVRVDAVAYQFAWEYRYPAANLTTNGVLVVPTDRDVYLNLTSRDVIHALFVPEWGVKQDAFPERYTTILTNVDRPGVYRYYCTQFCGVGHSRMVGDAVAVSQERYEAWLDAHRGERGVTEAPAPANGTNATSPTSPTPASTPPGA